MKKITNFDDARLVIAENTVPPKEVVTYTLDRIKAALEFLGNPQDEFKTIHVAGTSGKTSTAYYAAALLRAAGKKVGLTVSPHVDEINERVQINLLPMPEKQFCQTLGEFLEVIKPAKIRLSYYELMIAFAFWEFARQKVDYAVIEVGLGGLLDGTNVMTRADKVCIITDIGLDHVEILGDTLTKIAAQKAGIILPHNHVFMYEQFEDITHTVAAAAQAVDAKLHIVPDGSAAAPASGLPLFQQRNMWLAAYATNYVLFRDTGKDLTAQQINQAAQTYVPARMEKVILDDKTLIIDGSHNGQKINTLIESIRQQYPDQSIAAMVAFVSGADSRWQQGIDALLPAVKTLIITEYDADQDTPKTSVKASMISAYLTHTGRTCIVEKEPKKALEALLKQDADIYLVVGSFYLLNHIRPLILKP